MPGAGYRLSRCRGEGVDLGTAHWVGAETARRRGKPKQLPFSYRGPFGRQWARIAALSGKLRGRPVLGGNGAVCPQTERRVSERRGASCLGSGASALPPTPERLGTFATINKHDYQTRRAPSHCAPPAEPMAPAGRRDPNPQPARRLRRRVQTMTTSPPDRHPHRFPPLRPFGERLASATPDLEPVPPVVMPTAQLIREAPDKIPADAVIRRLPRPRIGLRQAPSHSRYSRHRPPNRTSQSRAPSPSARIRISSRLRPSSCR